MKVPCKDCLTLAICKQKTGTLRIFEIDVCPLVRNYINNEELLGKHPMYRRTRINKLRNLFGYRKLKGRKS